MIKTTTMDVAGHRVTRTIGLVRGSAVRSLALSQDITAAFKNMVGGEVLEYTKLLAEVREQALDRMEEEARARGAHAVVGVRFASSEVSSNAAEILAYGTAVELTSTGADEQDAES